MVLEGGYAFGQRRSLENTYSSIDQDWNTASLRWRYTDRGTFDGGLETMISATDYENQTRNDAESVSLGLFANWTPSDYTSFFGSIGIQEFQFDDSRSLNGSRNSSIYGALGISNQLNNEFRQTLSIGQGSQLSDLADYTENSYIRYGVDWDATDGTRLNGYLSYNRSKEGGEGRNERLDSIQVGLNLSQKLTEHLTLGLRANHSSYRSNLTNRDYSEWRAQTWLSWQVNRAFSITGSYEHWRAQGDAHFKENRLLLGTSLSF